VTWSQRAADQEGNAISAALASLKDAKTILLTTCKRDGTPVSIAFDGDRAFFRSYDEAWKTRRLRHDPRVQAAT
jgi:PPOX class probable F420-dependent enzyme